MRMMRASWVLMRRKSRGSALYAISLSAPASSTPVGPPPMMANVSHARRFAASSSRSASSKAKRTRRRISRASSRLFSPGASSSHSGWPKYVSCAPAATMRWSYWTEPKSVNRRTRLARSIEATSARITSVFRCRRSTTRIGAATSLGSSAAVATW